jgi:hypothetical protein
MLKLIIVSGFLDGVTPSVAQPAVIATAAAVKHAVKNSFLIACIFFLQNQ